EPTDDGQPSGTASTEGARSIPAHPPRREGLAVAARAPAEHEASAEQGDAAEQDRQCEEARERELAGVGAGLDLARLLHVVAALVLLAEDAAGRLVLVAVLLDAGVIAGQPLNGEA